MALLQVLDEPMLHQNSVHRSAVFLVHVRDLAEQAEILSDVALRIDVLNPHSLSYGYQRCR